MTINGKEVAFEEGMTVCAAARRAGIEIPTLCDGEGLPPTGGCGVCVVEDAATGRLFPACATRAQAAFEIQTDSPAAADARRAAVELLLSNHPADCEAPCQLACPSGLPVPELMERLAEGDWEGAAALARRYPVSCGVSAPCEKACRRGPLGGAVSICALHRWLVAEATDAGKSAPVLRGRAKFRTRMDAATAEALLAFCREPGDRVIGTADAVTRETAAREAGRCLQCGCLKPDACRLRELGALTGARPAAFAGGKGPVVRQRTENGFHFDAARCVLCGLCVRTAARRGASVGPAFHGRGFDAVVGPPLGRTWNDIPEAVLAACAEICPTGAMVKTADVR